MLIRRIRYGLVAAIASACVAVVGPTSANAATTTCYWPVVQANGCAYSVSLMPGQTARRGNTALNRTFNFSYYPAGTWQIGWDRPSPYADQNSTPQGGTSASIVNNHPGLPADPYTFHFNAVFINLNAQWVTG